MVKILTSLAEFKAYRALETATVGFVPTMGNLHSGHISLLERGLEDFEVVYFSIFVNPKQFGPHEDFKLYPRTLDEDVAKIEACLQNHPHKKVIVFAPSDPAEVFADSLERNISLDGIKEILEGKMRPGHFDGVASVVYRLFELVRPSRAYFGQKDYQQLLVIKKMVKDLVMPVEILGMPIIREKSGLALSSRNQYLSPDEKTESLTLSRTLKELSALIAGSRKNLSLAQETAQKILADKRWNYLEIRDAESLATDLTDSKKIVLLGVFQLRTTRLLDNLEVSIS